MGINLKRIDKEPKETTTGDLLVALIGAAIVAALTIIAFHQGYAMGQRDCFNKIEKQKEHLNVKRKPGKAIDNTTAKGRTKVS